MSSHKNLYDAFIFLAFTILLSTTSTALTTQINSNSVLVALLDSHYTELSELVEKALLLQTLEQTVSFHNITIFAPSNEALERQLDPEFKRFLLEPGNLKSLQSLLLYHIIPGRVGSSDWSGLHKTLLADDGMDNHLPLTMVSSEKVVGSARVTRPDDLIRPDGLIHGIERLLVPRSVQEDFNKRRPGAGAGAKEGPGANASYTGRTGGAPAGTGAGFFKRKCGGVFSGNGGHRFKWLWVTWNYSTAFIALT
nr:hypothetical protein [Tanacetum cinerariifolium]